MRRNKEQCTEKKAKSRTLSNIIFGIIIAVILTITTSFIATYYMNGCNFTRANIFGYRTVFVLSESMEPTLATHGTTILDMKDKDYKIGDIVVYEHQKNGKKMAIIHRIIGITSDGYIMQGDNNFMPDGWLVQKDDIVGKVCYIMNWTAPIADVFLR